MSKHKSTSIVNQQVHEIFDAWVLATKRTAQTKLDEKRRALIKRAIKSHGAETALQAVKGVVFSDWHMGVDPRSNGVKYDQIELILRNADRIEFFAGVYKPELIPEPVDKTRENLVDKFIKTLPSNWRESLEHLGVEIRPVADKSLDMACIRVAAALYAANRVEDAEIDEARAYLQHARSDLAQAVERSISHGRMAA